MLGRARSRSPRNQTEFTFQGPDGASLKLTWANKLQVLGQLMSWNLVTAETTELMQAQDNDALKEICRNLGPDSAMNHLIVQQKLEEFQRSQQVGMQQMQMGGGLGGGAMGGGGLGAMGGGFGGGGFKAAGGMTTFHPPPEVEAASRKMMETNVYTVYQSGTPIQLEWTSQLEVASKMHELGILDKGSAEFLAKAPEDAAKQVVSTLGPHITNYSAVVTKRLKEMMNSGALTKEQIPLSEGNFEEIEVYCQGVPRRIKWFGMQQTLGKLIQWGMLDDNSANYVMRASEEQAKEIIRSIGPYCQNPSALVTRKVKELKDAGQLLNDSPDFVGPFQSSLAAQLNSGQLDPMGQQMLYGDGQLNNGAMAQQMSYGDGGGVGVWRPQGGLQQQQAFMGQQMPPGGAGGANEGWGLSYGGGGQEILTIYVQGQPMEIEWTSKEIVVRTLLSNGIVSENCADFLMKANDVQAKAALACIGRSCRNASAVVTRKLRELMESPMAAAMTPMATAMTPISGSVWAGGGTSSLAAAGFGGGALAHAANTGMGQSPKAIVTIYRNGQPHQLQWFDQDTAIREAYSWGILDDTSAHFLLQIPEQHAMEVLGCIGPEVRNPPAVITSKISDLRNSGILGGQMSGDPMGAIGGMGDMSSIGAMGGMSSMGGSGISGMDMGAQMGATVSPMGIPSISASGQPIGTAPSAYPEPTPGETVTIYQNGQPRTLQWSSKEQVVEQLIIWNILDQNSAQFLMMATPSQAKEALTSLGPSVRNPSAVLTRKLREMAQGFGASLAPNPKKLGVM
eukprot:gnl/MRDRNA2_/MRDRNA2_83194_c0_seq4.p1 gnl/MRDRNA2_/MRDRNA2_83194_c0~~gnl/MRDRNA2_/MRDRNA2_83194_c0_seq4.p1  ORF type:complete len:792 (+),score=183.22 gnl/MRDRNA2_/MRDRNA2_83194_c0_seq4:78-2453(+)